MAGMFPAQKVSFSMAEMCTTRTISPKLSGEEEEEEEDAEDW
jgi:hypothetical protein